MVSSKGLSSSGTNRWREYFSCSRSPTSSISLRAWNVRQQRWSEPGAAGVAGTSYPLVGLLASSAFTWAGPQCSCAKSCFLSKNMGLTMNNGLWIAGIQDKGYNSLQYVMLGRKRNMCPGLARPATMCSLSFYTSVLTFSFRYHAWKLMRSLRWDASHMKDGESPQRRLLPWLSKNKWEVRRRLCGWEMGCRWGRSRKRTELDLSSRIPILGDYLIFPSKFCLSIMFFPVKLALYFSKKIGFI